MTRCSGVFVSKYLQMEMWYEKRKNCVSVYYGVKLTTKRFPMNPSTVPIHAVILLRFKS
jgi:hypothetical protein